MYSIYNIQKINGKTQLAYSIGIKLAGCKNGLIVKMLREKLPKIIHPPFLWSLNVAEEFHKRDQTVIIDIKPNNKDKEVFLCELDSVFGYSSLNYSPVMFRLKKLFSKSQLNEQDKKCFIYPEIRHYFILSYI